MAMAQASYHLIYRYSYYVFVISVWCKIQRMDSAGHGYDIHKMLPMDSPEETQRGKNQSRGKCGTIDDKWLHDIFTVSCITI